MNLTFEFRPGVPNDTVGPYMVFDYFGMVGSMTVFTGSGSFSRTCLPSPNEANIASLVRSAESLANESVAVNGTPVLVPIYVKGPEFVPVAQALTYHS